MAKAQTLIIQGPQTSHITKQAAEDQLQRHPNFPKGASFAVEDIGGHWVAAFTTLSEFPPPSDDEAPSGPPAGDEAPSPDGPPTDDSSSDGPPSDDKGGDDKKGEHGKGGELGEIKQMLTTLLTAMGLGGPDASMMPGDEAGPPGVPGGDEMGPEGPPDHGDMGGGDGKTHTVHERALKPGEAPPGTTPVGAPAFASVRIPEDHPWKQSIAAGQAEWVASDYINDGESIGVIAKELRELAAPYGYRVAQLNEGRDNQGNRVARARIARVR